MGLRCFLLLNERLRFDCQADNFIGFLLYATINPAFSNLEIVR